jgi:hypothetical protein
VAETPPAAATPQAPMPATPVTQRYTEVCYIIPVPVPSWTPGWCPEWAYCCQCGLWGPSQCCPGCGQWACDWHRNVLDHACVGLFTAGEGELAFQQTLMHLAG